MEKSYYVVSISKIGVLQKFKLCNSIHNFVNPTDLDALQFLNESDGLILAVEDGRIVGYISVVRDLVNFGDYCVNYIAVNENHQHKGIGSNMLQIAKNIAAEEKRNMIAFVDHTNQFSKATFKKSGFSESEYEDFNPIAEKFINNNPNYLDIPTISGPDAVKFCNELIERMTDDIDETIIIKAKINDSMSILSDLKKTMNELNNFYEMYNNFPDNEQLLLALETSINALTESRKYYKEQCDEGFNAWQELMDKRLETGNSRNKDNNKN